VEARNRITSRRALLPQDVQIIESIGITPDEYYAFLDQCEYACANRGKAYSHIPDVRNEPISTATLIQLAIGVALTVAGALLAPKPKSPDDQKQPPQLQTGDKTGKSKFTPYNDFDSVQELAALGTTIPLVYAAGNPGVRVNTQLLWSNIATVRNGQIAKLLLLISQGKLERYPDFEGIAIGDTLLENFDRARLGAWCRTDGGRIKEKTNAYKYNNGEIIGDLEGISVPDDVFSIQEYGSRRWYPWHSGSRTPGTATQFGLYNFVPNGNRFKLNYELVLIQDGAGKDTKSGQREKRDKINKGYGTGAGITRVDNKRISANSTSTEREFVRSGEIIEYTIRDNETFTSYDGGRWGLQDVVSATASRRATADDVLALGKIYRCGSVSMVCISEPDRVWELNRRDVVYKFRCIDNGEVRFGGPNAEQDPYDTYNIGEISNAIITTNRPEDDYIEIGIKSTVWKQISGFPNLNSQPSEKVIEEYEEEGGSIQLGSMQTYLFRMSFFKIMIRPIGESGSFNLEPGTIFCIKHNNPSEVFNSFRIEFADVTRASATEFEIKFQPVPGNYVKDKYNDMIILDTREEWQPNTVNTSRDGRYRLWYRGYRETISRATTSNPEFILGKPQDSGQVVRISPSQGGRIPSDDRESCSTEFSTSKGSYVKYDSPQEGKGGAHIWTYVWRGEKIKDFKVSSRDRDFPGEVKKKMDGRTYYFDKGDLEKNYGSTKYYEIRRCKRDADSDGRETRTENLTGGSGSGAKVRVTRYKNGAWESEIADSGKGYKNGDRLKLSVPGPDITVSVTTNDNNQFELNPYDMLADYPQYDGESLSNDNSAEHEISYVNEIRKPDGYRADYNDLATLGLMISSSLDITNISQVSTYVKRGIVGRAWTGNSSYRAINHLPEIVFDLLTNEEYGVGGIVGRRGVDEGELSRTTRYCQAMGFYWEGVIKEKFNVRQWIFEQAGYILCDFCIQGGKFFLRPSFPIQKNYRIHSRRRRYAADTRPVTIQALFTDGNVRDAKVSFLSPEERQMFKAEVIYRLEEPNGFSKLMSKTIRLKKNPAIGPGGGRDDDPLERFDMSGFCSSEEHAETFARYALRLRQLVTHTVQFQSTPESCRDLKPGDYVRYISTVTHLDRFATGSIGDSGAVQCHRDPKKLDGRRIMYWKIGKKDGVREANLRVDDTKHCEDSVLHSSVFALADDETRSRIYKVETIQYGEEGLVDLTLTEAPVDSELRLLVLDWRDDDFYEYN
jgi:hypothetical protein